MIGHGDRLVGRVNAAARQTQPFKGLRAGHFVDKVAVDIEQAGAVLGLVDLSILRRAHKLMRKHLEQEWARRAPNLPLQSPTEALILASIVEKETGLADERGMVAAVFINRLRIGMRLQTDPTVIYGMGAAFDGNIRKRDLLTDTPYNTYTRTGLPPTPIAMPGLDALRATLNPASSDALYFVARGDGTSKFSRTLAEHERAVTQYQRRGRR